MGQPKRTPDDPLLTVVQLAALEGIAEDRVRHLIRAHDLPAYKIGGVRIRLSEYRAWLAARRVRSAQDG
jgi:excisionase family DNA binding protein